MQFLELSVWVIVGVWQSWTVLHIRVCHSGIRRSGAAQLWISVWPLVLCSFCDTISLSVSYIRAYFLFAVITSREGGALVFDDFLKYVVKYALGIIWVVYLATDT